MNTGLSAARRRFLTDDNPNGGSGGGPGGVTGRGPIEIREEDTRAATGFYRRGAATAFVRVLSEGPLQLRRMRDAGLIELRQNVHGKDTVTLTALGLSHVMLAAAVTPAPGA